MSLFKKWLDPLKGWDHFTDFLHSVTGVPTAEQKRNTARMVSDQMNAYKKQTELADSMIEQKRQEQLMSRRRLDEKMVKSVRSRFGSSGDSDGFLGTGTAEFPDTLGA